MKSPKPQETTCVSQASVHHLNKRASYASPQPASHCVFGTPLKCTQALVQAAQRLWGLLLRDLQKPPRSGLGHPALGIPPGARLGQRDPEVPAIL